MLWAGDCAPVPVRLSDLSALLLSFKSHEVFTHSALTQHLRMRTFLPSLHIFIKALFYGLGFLYYFTGHISLHFLEKVIYFFSFTMVFSGPSALLTPSSMA